MYTNILGYELGKRTALSQIDYQSRGYQLQHMIVIG